MNEIEALMCLLIAGVFSVESTMASSLQCLGRLQVVLLTFTLLGFAGVATADRIHLKHGDYIDVDSWREEGDRILYQRFGGEIGVSKSDVLRIERRTTDPTQWQAPGSSKNTPSGSSPSTDSSMNPTAGPSLVEIVQIDTRMTERNNTFVRWAWRLELANRADL